jgi:hypothetical protein
MAGANLTFLESAAGRIATTAANVLVVIGAASLATTNGVYVFEDDGQIESSVGYGRGAELAAAICRAGARCVLVNPATGVAGTIGAVTETPLGSGPTLTVAGTPLDDLNIAVKITKAGAAGDGQFQVSTDDGGEYGPTREIPSPTAGTMLGTIDLNTITPSSLNTKTLIVTPDGGGSVTITFASVSTIADIISQVAAGAGFTASNAGGFLKITSDTTGATSSILIGAGTANADLGFTAATSNTGLASVYPIPATGITITFPVGSYLLDTVYTFATKAARSTTAELVAAAEAARVSAVAFAGFAIAQTELDAASSRVVADALKAKQNSLLTQKRPLFFLMGVPFDVTDTSVKDAFLTMNERGVAVAAGDCFIRGNSLLGAQRRSFAWEAAILCATRRFSSDIGNGADGPISEIVDWTRDETEATVKLRDFRFIVLETRSGDKTQAFVARGLTMALQSSRYTDLNLLRVAYQVATVAQKRFDLEVNNDRVLRKDGRISEAEAEAIERSMTGELDKEFVAPPKGQPHLSVVETKVNRDEQVSTTDNLTATISMLPKSQQKTVSVTLGYTTSLSLSE